ncbi:MAG: hypothetical protein ACK4RK_09085 [Gemmataceae bacterium]
MPCILWSQPISATVQGFALARERNWLVLWDAKQWLYLVDSHGQRQGQFQASADIRMASIADDGSGLAAVTANGSLLWLAPDMTLRWQETLSASGLSVATDPLGQYLAVADQQGQLHILDHLGQRISQSQCPRPLRYLAFIPEAPALVGCADFGWVACGDWRGNWQWHDGLVAHVGSLAVDGAGQAILLACYGEGLRQYAVTGKHVGRLAVGEPCRLAAVSYDGQWLAAADLSHRLLLIDREQRIRFVHALEQPPVAVALSPLADRAYVLLANGVLTCLETKDIIRSG